MGTRLSLAAPFQQDFLVEEELLPRMPLHWPPQEQRGGESSPRPRNVACSPGFTGPLRNSSLSRAQNGFPDQVGPQEVWLVLISFFDSRSFVRVSTIYHYEGISR